MVWDKLIIRNAYLSVILALVSLAPFMVIVKYALPDNLLLNIWMSLLIFLLFMVGLFRSFFQGLRIQKEHSFILAALSMVIYMFLMFLWLLIIALSLF